MSQPDAEFGQRVVHNYARAISSAARRRLPREHCQGVVPKEGLALGIDGARLYRNLIRSYLTFLIAEHKRVSRGVT